LKIHVFIDNDQTRGDKRKNTCKKNRHEIDLIDAFGVFSFLEQKNPLHVKLLETILPTFSPKKEIQAIFGII